MTAPLAKDALFCFATGGFNFVARKTDLDTPVYERTGAMVTQPFACGETGEAH